MNKKINGNPSFDDILKKGIFGNLTPDEQIKIYFDCMKNEGKDSEKRGPIRRIVDYNPHRHYNVVDELIQSVPFLSCGCDLPELEEERYSIEVCLSGEEIAGVIAHKKMSDMTYIGVISTVEKLKGHGIMSLMIDHVAKNGYPIVAKILNSNSEALAAFEKCNFQRAGCINGYYDMVRELSY